MSPHISNADIAQKINVDEKTNSDILFIHDGDQTRDNFDQNIAQKVSYSIDIEDEINVDFSSLINDYKILIVLVHNYHKLSLDKYNELSKFGDNGGLIILHLYSFMFNYHDFLNSDFFDKLPFHGNSVSNTAATWSKSVSIGHKNSLFEGVTEMGTSHTNQINTIFEGTKILANWTGGRNSGQPFVGVKDNVYAVNFYPRAMTGDYIQFYNNLLGIASMGINIQGATQYDLQLNSLEEKLSLNVTIENGTTYDAYLNGDLIDSQNYQNGTIDIDISKLYSNYTYTNYTVFNNTKYEYSNLTLAFHTEQNNTYTHFVNVTVYDYLPQIIGTTSMNFNYEIGNSLSLKFNVSDDNPDMVYVYSNNVLLYSQNWTYNLNIDVNNFINSSNKLGYNYYKVIFEDIDNNQVEYNLQINVLDTVNPIFTSVFADDYIEGDEFGVISFSVDDVTLDRYAVFANDIELANSTFGNTSYIEISNSGLLAGNYEVEIVVYDRANNIAKITTSFVVESQGVTSTVTVDPPVSNSTVTSDTSTSDNNTITVTETNNVTIQGNNTQNVSVPASLPISDLPLILFASFIGLYIFRKNRK